MNKQVKDSRFVRAEIPIFALCVGWGRVGYPLWILFRKDLLSWRQVDAWHGKDDARCRFMGFNNSLELASWVEDGSILFIFLNSGNLPCDDKVFSAWLMRTKILLFF